MSGYAKGRRAFGIDDISGFKVPYRNLKTQWNGLRVAEPDFDTRHPQDTPTRRIHDPTSLRDPRPEADSGATSYPTMNYTATQPGYTTWGATTQLTEVLSMTFGGAT